MSCPRNTGANINAKVDLDADGTLTSGGYILDFDLTNTSTLVGNATIAGLHTYFRAYITEDGNNYYGGAMYFESKAYNNFKEFYGIAGLCVSESTTNEDTLFAFKAAAVINSSGDISNMKGFYCDIYAGGGASGTVTAVKGIEVKVQNFDTDGLAILQTVEMFRGELTRSAGAADFVSVYGLRLICDNDKVSGTTYGLHISFCDESYLDGILRMGGDIELTTHSVYIQYQEQATSTEANKRYLLMKDSAGNIVRVPCYDNA